MRHVLIVYPFMPRYRVPLFAALTTKLRETEVELDIAHGAPDVDIAGRRDTVELPSAVALPQRRVDLRVRDVTWKVLPPLDSYDLVVMEQAIGNLEAWKPLLARRGPAIALWGHGRTYTKPVTRAEAVLKNWMTRRADWFFAYTDRGADHVVAHGYPRERTTVLRNTEDISALTSDVETDPDPSRATTAAYIGGLDASKRVPFLLEAARLAHERMPGFRLLVAGRGSEEHLVERAAAEHDWVEWVGFADDDAKRSLGQRASVLVVPGRVGLVAVDSMALGMPLVTTDFAYHAPEIEYLQDEDLIWSSHEDETAFADEVVRLMADQGRVTAAATRLRALAASYTMEGFVDRFAAGICAAVEAGPRR